MNQNKDTINDVNTSNNTTSDTNAKNGKTSSDTDTTTNTAKDTTNTAKDTTNTKDTINTTKDTINDVNTSNDNTALSVKLISESPVGIIMSDVETHEIYYTNEAFRRIMHLSDDNYLGKKCYKYVRNDDEPCSNCAAHKLKIGESCERINSFPQDGIYLSTRSRLTTWNGHKVLVEYNTDVTSTYLQHIMEQDLLNRVPGGIGICENSRDKVRVLYLNDGYYQIIVQTREERGTDQTRELFKYVHPDDVIRIKELGEALEKGSDLESCDYRIMCGERGYRWIHIVSSVIKRENGVITTYCNYTDVDDAVRSRAKLEKANSELNTQYKRELARRKEMEKNCLFTDCFNVTQNHMVSSSTQQGEGKGEGKSEGKGDVKSDISKYNLEDVMNSSLDSIPLEEDKERFRQVYDRKGMMERFERGEKDSNIEYRSTGHDGRLHWMRAATSMMEDPTTSDLLVYTYIYDIDEEKKRQLAIEQVTDEEIEYVLLVDTHNEATIIVDLNPVMVRVETDKTIVYHIIPNSPHFDHVLDSDRQSVQDFYNIDKIRKQLEGKTIVSNIYSCLTSAGAATRKEERAFYLDETKDNIVIVRRDITESYDKEQEQKENLQKALDAANAANKAKSEFLSRMSHDIRNPMNEIVGMTRLVRDSKTSDERNHYLAQLDASSTYFLGLLNDILTMSKITEGKITLNPEAVKTAEFMEQILIMVRAQADEKGVNFEVRFADGPEVPYQFFDTLRVRQILYNILNNAVKFTHRGGHVVYTAGHVERMGKIWCRHVIEDNGVGMSPEFLTTVFTPFVQEENSESGFATGTGLGLSICKQLCDLMGGSIQVESKLGKGTTFTVEIPTTQLTEEEYAKQITRASGYIGTAKGTGVLKGKKVIICEDHPVNREILEKLLAKKGVITLSAENGRDGVELFTKSKEGEINAILMDIRMPVMDGLTAAKAIRGLDRPDAAKVPIIAISANAFQEDLRASADAGMNDHLAKPVDPDKLYEVLTRWTEK